MDLDFSSFTLKGLLEDRASCTYLGEKKHGEGGGCRTRNESEEDGDHRPGGDGEVIVPSTQLHREKFQ